MGWVGVWNACERGRKEESEDMVEVAESMGRLSTVAKSTDQSASLEDI